MNSYSRKPSSGTAAYEQWLHEQELTNSAITKMQKQFWVTKQTVFKKLGKKEDECIVASDSELDAKLELYRSIQQSCCDLQRIIERYQEKLCSLSQDENAMGRFLKEAGKNDKTRAGKMMTSVGKSLSYCGQQRLTLRMPLMRLHQEVDTFRRRAIEDTQQNVSAMEKARTEYRASLNWMKEVSQQLDPDTNKQMDRFRKVQTQVRRSKVRFDQQKLDCLQKVDLLAAARCNMFSHALILYQSSLLTFAENAAKTFDNIANSFRGYQHYEFSVVKELTETSMKLAEETGQIATEDIDEDKKSTADKDQLLFFESEYHDEADKKENAQPKPVDTGNKDDSELEEVLLDLNLGPTTASSSDMNGTQSTEYLLEDLFSAPTDNSGSAFGAEWQAVFGAHSSSSQLLPDLMEDESKETDSFLPSRLLDNWSSKKDSASSAALSSDLASLHLQPSTPTLTPIKKESTGGKNKTAAGVDMSAWFNVFADLDPLANPDAISRHVDQRGEEEEQRNC